MRGGRAACAYIGRRGFSTSRLDFLLVRALFGWGGAKNGPGVRTREERAHRGLSRRAGGDGANVFHLFLSFFFFCSCWCLFFILRVGASWFFLIELSYRSQNLAFVFMLFFLSLVPSLPFSSSPVFFFVFCFLVLNAVWVLCGSRVRNTVSHSADGLELLSRLVERSGSIRLPALHEAGVAKDPATTGVVYRTLPSTEPTPRNADRNLGVHVFVLIAPFVRRSRRISRFAWDGLNCSFSFVIRSASDRVALRRLASRGWACPRQSPCPTPPVPSSCSRKLHSNSCLFCLAFYGLASPARDRWRSRINPLSLG